MEAQDRQIDVAETCALSAPRAPKCNAPMPIQNRLYTSDAEREVIPFVWRNARYHCERHDPVFGSTIHMYTFCVCCVIFSQVRTRSGREQTAAVRHVYCHCCPISSEPRAEVHYFPITILHVRRVHACQDGSTHKQRYVTHSYTHTRTLSMMPPRLVRDALKHHRRVFSGVVVFRVYIYRNWPRARA